MNAAEVSVHAEPSLARSNGTQNRSKARPPLCLRSQSATGMSSSAVPSSIREPRTIVAPIRAVSIGLRVGRRNNSHGEVAERSPWVCPA